MSVEGAHHDPWVTRRTLLLKVVEKEDHDAWEDFVDFYGKFIFHLILKLGVPYHDSDDLSQQILIKLWEKLDTYSVEKGCFRPWLSAVIRNAAYSHYNKNSKQTWEPIEHHELSSPSEVEEMIESQWESYLTEKAMEKVKQTFSETSVKAFLMSVEGQSHADISKELGVSQASVKVLKSRVKKCFVLEMRKMIEQKEK